MNFFQFNTTPSNRQANTNSNPPSQTNLNPTPSLPPASSSTRAVFSPSLGFKVRAKLQKEKAPIQYGYLDLTQKVKTKVDPQLKIMPSLGSQVGERLLSPNNASASLGYFGFEEFARHRQNSKSTSINTEPKTVSEILTPKNQIKFKRIVMFDFAKLGETKKETPKARSIKELRDLSPGPAMDSTMHKAGKWVLKSPKMTEFNFDGLKVKTTFKSALQSPVKSGTLSRYNNNFDNYASSPFQETEYTAFPELKTNTSVTQVDKIEAIAQLNHHKSPRINHINHMSIKHRSKTEEVDKLIEKKPSVPKKKVLLLSLATAEDSLIKTSSPKMIDNIRLLEEKMEYPLVPMQNDAASSEGSTFREYVQKTKK